MIEQEFREKFRSEKIMYESFGGIVLNQIINYLIAENKVDINYLFQIPVAPRVKEEESLVYKAFHRTDKFYENPYEEIEDKVGLRFVVLYKDDINIIKEAIENINIWSRSKDRDFDDQRCSKPEHFGYESVHYVVRNNKEIKLENITIPANTPCEIQIRTLLQHAYCQVSHDTMYKKTVLSKSKRDLSRSMALIESADIFFEGVKNVVNEEQENYKNLLFDLTEYYRTFCKNISVEKKFNNLIIETFRDYLNFDIIKDVIDYIDEHNFIKDNIKEKSEAFFIYRQPVIILMYFLVSKDSVVVEDLWPLTANELENIYTDLGISFNC